MRSGRWAWQVYSLELRKILSYRMDFWLHFAGSTLTYVLISFYLWKSIYDANPNQDFGGLNFQAMVYYYLLVGLVDRGVRGLEMGLISEEIYRGGLNRYLVYPVSFFGFKGVIQLAHASVALAQLGLMLLGACLVFGAPDTANFGPTGWLQGVAAVLMGALLNFLMNSAAECVAFWAENTWSLQVMIRLSGSILGGGFLPLALFPDSMRAWMRYLPFEYLTSFPVLAFLGRLEGGEWKQATLVVLAWTLIFSVFVNWIWRRGLRTYSGVGM
ncbi:MAG: ABC-2 family transporter protein [Bdellovibrionota bacterium]